MTEQHNTLKVSEILTNFEFTYPRYEAALAELYPNQVGRSWDEIREDLNNGKISTDNKSVLDHKRYEDCRDMVLKLQSRQTTEEKAAATIRAMYEFQNRHEISKVTLHGSPEAARKGALADETISLNDDGTYNIDPMDVGHCTEWNRFQLFVLYMGPNWVPETPNAIFFDFLCHVFWVHEKNGICHVSQYPSTVVYSEEYELSNYDGPVYEFNDGYRRFCLENFPVADYVVEDPSQITLEEIHGEENEELRRILMEQFGFLRYIEESGSEVLDLNRNDVENTTEILARFPDGRLRLVTHCPSTGRRYSLGLPEGMDAKNCQEAQTVLWGGKNVNIIGRT